MHKINPEILFTIIAGSILLIVLGSFIVVFLLQYQKRKFRHQQHIIKLQDTFEQTLLQTQLEIQEQTLRNLSQEIHDNIGQVLSLAKLNLGMIDIASASDALQKINDSKTLVAKAIKDLRDLSKSLNTDYILEMSLPISISSELDMLKKTGSFETSLEISGTFYEAEKQKELIIFRIVQEVLNNIIKHAAASRITILLSYQINGLCITISDNGKGFDLDFLQKSHGQIKGLGIRNMHSRARMAGGIFSITSTIGKGTTVNINLPI